MRYFLLLIIITGISTSHAQQTFLPLWPEGIPCENELEMEIEDHAKIGKKISKVHEPGMVAFFPPKEKANGSSILICPGGGYTILAWDWEGTEMAKWFNSFGITAFVLRYRLPHWESEECRSEVALMDAKRAMRIIRSKAMEWNLDAEKVGVMGFSAGGHLASTLITQFDYGNNLSEKTVDRFSSRPDFAVLMYPVISMDPEIAHMGSRRNLIGKEPEPYMIEKYSSEKQVSTETPATLLIHADNDKGVVPENSVQFYLALRKHKVPATLYIFESGGHGFSFAKDQDGAVKDWPHACRAWLAEGGWAKDE